MSNKKNSSTIPIVSTILDEDLYASDIDKNKFFKLAEEFGINFSILLGKKSMLRDCHRFNLFLRSLKEKHGFYIKDCLIFLYEEFTKFKKILRLLDQENRFHLKRELAKNNKRVNFRDVKSKLKEFMEFGEEDFG